MMCPNQVAPRRAEHAGGWPHCDPGNEQAGRGRVRQPGSLLKTENQQGHSGGVS